MRFKIVSEAAVVHVPRGDGGDELVLKRGQIYELDPKDPAVAHLIARGGYLLPAELPQKPAPLMAPPPVEGKSGAAKAPPLAVPPPPAPPKSETKTPSAKPRRGRPPKGGRK
ncbi:hypothetical protein K8I61_17300 [bacterium]|nr:hypothetical protein [bacterium]